MLSSSAAKRLRFFLNDHLAEVDLVLAAPEVRSALRDQSKHAKLSKCLSYSYSIGQLNLCQAKLPYASPPRQAQSHDITHDHYEDRHDDHYDDHQALPSMESLLFPGSCNRVQTQVTR